MNGTHPASVRSPRPTREPRRNRQRTESPSQRGRASGDIFPRPPTTNPRRPECEPIPVPHAGEDDPHNECADKFPPNRYPGMDVLVDGVRFDALQVGVRVLWEIKTHQFDTYNAFIRRREIEKELEQLRKERTAAAACGYDFVIGVSTQAHKDALLRSGSHPQCRRHGVQTMTYAKNPHPHRLRACARGQRRPHARCRPWDGKGAPRLAPGVGGSPKAGAPSHCRSAMRGSLESTQDGRIPAPVQRGRELPRDG